MGKNYVVLKIKVAPQTAYHLERMAAMSRCSHEPLQPWSGGGQAGQELGALYERRVSP